MRTWRALTALAVLGALGCDKPPTSATDAAEGLVCPELGGRVDPLEISYSSTPAADARIRAFVAASRGLHDVTLEIERRAVEACRQMRRDLGAPEAPSNAAIDVQCEPVRALLAKLAREGVQVRISIAPPRCEPDAGRKSRCDALGQAGGTQALCEAEAAVYARCSLPSISFASSTNLEETIRLGRTLEANLPTLLYAEMALARRLVDHAQAIVTASVRLPNELPDAGPRGMACVGLAAAADAKSAERLRAFLASSGALIAGLDPEVQAAGGAR